MSRILIVDDDRTTTRLLQTFLELDGHTVEVSSAGADAIRLILESKPDAVLMDYRLGDGITGLDVIKKVRTEAEFSKLPIILTSGMDIEYEAKESGATSFLLKPYDPDMLSKMIAEMA